MAVTINAKGTSVDSFVIGKAGPTITRSGSDLSVGSAKLTAAQFIGPATKLTVADTSDATTFPVLVGAATGDELTLTDGGLTYNASTAALSTTTFVGALTGNADTATTAAAWTTTRTINMTGDVSSNAVNIDGSGNVTITSTLIAADAVTYSKMQNVVSDDRILGNIAGAGGIVAELTAANVRTMINVENNSTADQTSIVGITGTKAQFDTAVTDGNIAYVGGAHHDGFSDFVANEHLDWTTDTGSVIQIDNLSPDVDSVTPQFPFITYDRSTADIDYDDFLDSGIFGDGGGGGRTNAPDNGTFNPFMILRNSSDVRVQVSFPRVPNNPIAYRPYTTVFGSWHYSGWTTTVADADLSIYAKSAGAFHDGFSDFVANEHIDWTAGSAGTIHIDNYIENATHTGQVEGSGALTLNSNATAITDQPSSGAIVAADTILINDGGTLSEATFTQMDTYFNSSLSFGTPTVITVADSSNTTASIAFFESPTGDLGPKTDSQLTYNATTGALTAVTFVGALSGNATTATALATGRTIGMTGDVAWTSASFTGAGNVTGTSTIQADSVTMNMIVDIATDTFLGRVTGGTGTVEVLTNAQAKTALDLTGTNSGDNAGVTGTGTDNFIATWNGTGAINADGNSFLIVNAVDKTATEAITGTWTLDGPVGTADFGTGGRVKDGLDNSQPIGFNTIPIYEIDVADTFDLAHVGMMWHKDSGGAVAFTCNNDANIPVGASYLVHNDDTEDLTIIEGTATIEFLAPGAAPVGGTVTVEQGGIVTVYKYTDAIFWVWGAAAGATAVNITVADESSDTSCFPIFTTAATGDLPAKSGDNLTFNSSSGLLTATLLAGAGSAITALNMGNAGSGTLAVVRGGTGQTTYINGQLLIGNTSGNTLTKATLTAGAGIDITNGGGTITIIGETASLTNAGIVELATITETNTGTDAGRAVTPDGLDGWTGSAQFTTAGTIDSGTWEGTTVAVNQGGTGVTTSTGTGNVVLSASPTFSGTIDLDGTAIRNSVNENIITWTANAQIGLYYNNTLALQTQNWTAADDLSSVQILNEAGNMRDAGFAIMEEIAITTAKTIAPIDAHKTVRVTTNTNAIEFTSDVNIAVGAVGWILNTSSGSISLTATTNIAWMDGTGTTKTGNRTLAVAGWVTWWKQADAQYYITGIGIT